MDNLLVTNSAWALIRELFTEAQKVKMREAMTGEMICPPGIMVDADALPKGLADILRSNLKAANARLKNREKR